MAVAVNGETARIPTSINFAETAWGDSMAAVDTKLRLAGMGGLLELTFQTKETGPVRSRYFEGSLLGLQINGYVWFVSGGLQYLSVFVDPPKVNDDSACTKFGAALRDRYGLPTSQPVRGMERWMAGSGDVLEFTCRPDRVARMDYFSKKALEMVKSNEKREINKL